MLPFDFKLDIFTLIKLSLYELIIYIHLYFQFLPVEGVIYQRLDHSHRNVIIT